ncbi:hypothetical protein KIU71_03185 [Alteromonas sp. SM 2104]|nr:hypothetical protein [Alteromonas oceanisediminis]
MLGGRIAELDKNHPWGQLSCLYGESLMPPSAYAIFVKQIRIRQQAGLLALAVVIRDSDVARTIKNQLTAAYEDVGVDYAFFDDIDSALPWLQHKDIRFESAAVCAFFDANTFV